MSSDKSIPDRKRLVSREDHGRNGHSLVRVAERLPGHEPTVASRPLTDGPSYGTRYWRCRHCGQERNRKRDFIERCEGTRATLHRADGGYSIEEPRTHEALSDDLIVRSTETTGVYDVHEGNGLTQAVDVVAETCTCRDRTRRGAYCKHLRRIDLEIRIGTIPGLEP